MAQFAYVDGAYLSRCLDDFSKTFGGDLGKIRFNRLREFLSASKLFYYDSLQDIQLEGEPEADFKQRVAQQEKQFAEIGAHEYVHVRFGTLSGNGLKGKRRARREQKEVDVLLAVDVLTHAFRGSADVAVILAGDADFRPVVDTLVQLGKEVWVVADPDSCSPLLRESADRFIPMTPSILSEWSTASYLGMTYSFLPTIERGAVSVPHAQQMIETGRAGERSFKIYFDANKNFVAILDASMDSQFNQLHMVRVVHPNLDAVKRFLSHEFGSIST